MALELFNKCPRCGKPIITQTTTRNTVIQKCAKKVDGGCGFFANLGHVPKEGTSAAQKLEEKIEDSPAHAGEDTGASGKQRAGAKPTKPAGAGKAGTVHKPEERIHDEPAKADPPKKRSWFSRGLDF